MEQKENLIDKDLELSVVLPGDMIRSTTVNGSKPMMDLLIFLCAQYHLNPSGYTIDLISAKKSQIKFKPNTPIGMLEVDKVILKPKHMDKKKPTPTMPEQTVRVVVNYKRTQKTVVRVSPHEPLQEFIAIICRKCEFDPLHTVLLKNYQSQEPLDVTKSLNDLGLRELYAMDVKVTSAADFNLSSLQDSCQMSQNLDTLKEKENKGFFSFFQRSKKKREQTASAPATPLMSKARPTFINRSNTISKQYDSNTLPSEMPKKRRAPLPPMPSSQSVPQDLAHAQVRPTSSCVVKSRSVDENEQGQSKLGIVRTGSLQLSGTSSVNSSMRRTKRKAPSPPSRRPQNQSDNSKRTASESAESIPTAQSIVEERDTEVRFPTGNEVDIARATVPSCASHCSDAASSKQSTLPRMRDDAILSGNTGCRGASEMASKCDCSMNGAGICSEYRLDEISEKEEKNIRLKEENDSADSSSMTQEVSPAFVSTDASLDTKKNDSASSSSVFGNSSVENPQSSKEEKQENMSTDGKGPYNKIDSEHITFENNKKLGILDPDKNYDYSGTRFLLSTTGEKENQPKMGEINTADVRVKNKLEANRLSNCQEYKNDISTNQVNSQINLGIQDQKLNQTNMETVKTQDVAIQTAALDSFGRTTLNEQAVLQDCESSTFKEPAHVQNLDVDHPPLQLMNKVQESVKVSTEFSHKKQEVADDKTIPIKHQSNILENEDSLALSESAPKSPVTSPNKGYPLYRQDSKPKPSNEITREYIPKIGMTTYKIVPPKSLEIVSDSQLCNMSDIKDQNGVTLEMSPESERSKEFGVQTEILWVSKSTRQSESGLTAKTGSYFNNQLHKSNTIDSASVSECGLTAESKQIETEASKPNIGNAITPLKLNSGNTNSSHEAQEKSSVLSPTIKPSSFYLQMQRRASGHYVTSAIAKSVSAATSPTQSEAINAEREKNLTSPDQSLFPLQKTINFPAQLDEEKIERKIDTTSTSVNTAKPLSFPSSQPTTLNLRTLRTFAVPKPYSSFRPSPFALAVSSAVKRSQSFNKPRTIGSQPSREESPVALSSATSIADVKKQFLETFMGGSQYSTMDKKSNCSNSDQNTQVQSSADHPTTVFERETAVTFQSSDPEQIHQSLMAAIRSGEAAAKLKRVAAPSYTVSINGRSRLSHSFSTEEKYNH